MTKEYSFYMWVLVGIIAIWPIYSYMFAKLFRVVFWKALWLDSITYFPCLLFLIRELVPASVFPHGISYDQKIVYFIGFTYSAIVTLKIAIFSLYLFKSRHILLNYSYRQVAWILFILCLASYLAFSIWVNRTNLSGDEPHYMLITHSIVYDQDLNLTNNLLQKDYLLFYPNKLTPPLHGLPYSMHREGLPLVLAPAYFLAGLSGARAMISLITAALVVFTFFVINRIIADVKISMLASLMMAFSVPVAIYSNQIYPEILGAFVIMLALSRMIASPSSTRSINKQQEKDIIIVALCISALPFTNIRYILLAFGLLLASLLWIRGSYPVRRYAVLLGIVSIAAVFYLYSCYYMYGSFFSISTFKAMGLKGYIQNFSLNNLSKSSLYLLFDQQGGLFFFSPIYSFLFLGIALGLKFYRKESTFLLAIIGCYFFLFIVFSGLAAEGWCPPGRYLLTVIPLIMIFVSFSLKHCKTRVFKFIWRMFCIISIFFVIILSAVPHLRYPWTPGKNQVLELIGRLFNIGFSQYLPNVISPSIASSILIFIWILFLIGASTYFYLNESRV